MPGNDALFKREIHTLEQGKCLLDDPGFADDPLLPAYAELLHQYQKLFTQFKRMVKMTDRMHNDLTLAKERLAKLSTVDPLTGLANRRRFDEHYVAEWHRSQRQDQPLSVIMIDIDYFKPYNDTYGHGGGDTCLQSVAQAIASIPKRPLDMVARYGGEEFVALLPDTDLAGATEVAQHMRQVVCALAIPHAASKTAPHVSISLGVATCSDTTPDPAALLRLADARLYHAKELGRNCVCDHSRPDV